MEQVIIANTMGLSEGTHTFNIRVRNEDGIWSLEDSVSFEIFEFNNDNGIRIFPNPASDILKIESENSFEKLDILNDVGQIVLSMEEENMIFDLDIRSLRPSIYFVRLYFGEDIVTRKFVKQ